MVRILDRRDIKTMSLLVEDQKRYARAKDMPKYQKYMRRYQDASNRLVALFYRVLFAYFRKKALVEISANTKIGGGYI